jgi:hypothetical protein
VISSGGARELRPGVGVGELRPGPGEPVGDLAGDGTEHGRRGRPQARSPAAVPISLRLGRSHETTVWLRRGSPRTRICEETGGVRRREP